MGTKGGSVKEGNVLAEMIQCLKKSTQSIPVLLVISYSLFVVGYSVHDV